MSISRLVMLFLSCLAIGTIDISGAESRSHMPPTAKERIVASLKALAIGDAIGKQTENLSREDVLRRYPDGVRGFEGTPGTVVPRYVGNRKREWRIGETTDDTERTIAVARAILRDRAVRHESVGREMLGCRKCIHPGLKSLWEFHQAGDPTRVAERHDGCGAAVRVAPVGMLYRSTRLGAIVDGAREASISTHGGTLAIAAAAATAASVSAAIDGASPPDIIALAVRAAERVERDRSVPPTSGIAHAIRTIYDDLGGRSLHPPSVAARYFPNQPLTIAPLAVALATVLDAVGAAVLLAANVGGDSDSVASIAGAILGARRPDTVNEEWYTAVYAVNGDDLVALAEELGRLRS
jgi:ADP-ribosylglycohydrolase